MYNSKLKSVDDPTESEPLQVAITDSYSENNKQFFKIITKSSLRTYNSTSEITVNRTHEEFEWLYYCLKENHAYAGTLFPSKPFMISFNYCEEICAHEIPDGGCISENWIDDELKRAYYGIFKRAVNLHEMFLKRIVAQPILREDRALMLFLTEPVQLGKSFSPFNAIKDFAKNIFKFVNTNLFDQSNQAGTKSDETDEEIENHKVFLKGYVKNLVPFANQGTSIVTHQKAATLHINKVACDIKKLTTYDYQKTQRFFNEFINFLEDMRKYKLKLLHYEESQVVDIIRYIQHESQEALDLIARREKTLKNTKNLERSFGKAKETFNRTSYLGKEYENAQKELQEITDCVKTELNEQTKYRMNIFKSNLTSFCEKTIAGSNAKQGVIKKMIDILEAEDFN